MPATRPSIAADLLSPSRLAKDFVRRYRLRGDARVLDIGSGDGEVVARLRSCGVNAFGLFDGSAPPRDPEADVTGQVESPAIQAAVLHQSVPFPAQSFDAVLLRNSDVYCGALSSPEACTATANLLASLKPGQPLVYCGPVSQDAIEAHFTTFPGAARRIMLGTGGLGGLLRRFVGQQTEQPAIEFTIPAKPISRLEWHRLARQAVMAAQQQPAA